MLKEQCHHLRIFTAHAKLEKLHPVVFQVCLSKMADAHGETHGGKRRNSGRKRKHSGSTSSQLNWNARHKRLYLSIKIFETWKESKIVAGYGSSTDSDFAAHLLSLEYRRR